MIEQMMRSTAFDKITAVYGHIDENGLFVRKWLARKIPITDKMVKNSCLSVKCVLITDKSAKKGTLSVILSEILACLPEQEKIRANHGTDLNHYSVERSALHLHNQAQTSNKAGLHTFIIGFMTARFHTFTFPQSQTLACLSANLFPSNFDSKAIWHFSASRFGCCRNPN